MKKIIFWGLIFTLLALGASRARAQDFQNNDRANNAGVFNFNQDNGGRKFHFRKEKNHSRVCVTTNDGSASCHAQVVVDNSGVPVSEDQITPDASSGPAGYGPANFLSAYNLSGKSATHQIIAIVDAYDDPNIYSDLSTYSTFFGIKKLSSCPVSRGSTSAPCFQKVSQDGGTRYPSVNSGWALETALDVETAHAICQNCSILLVEAKSASYNDLMTAIDRARLMGAKIISNSWGSSEFAGETAFDSHFNYPGIAFTFSSGDGGYGVEYPAASKYVTAVGGTTLNVSSNNSYLSEAAWGGAGSGCSSYEPQPSFQFNLNLIGCQNRIVADVSADADPSTGAAVYNSVRYGGQRGWFQVGGTSLASPIVAGVYALGGLDASIYGNTKPYTLASISTLRDVTGGSNGSCLLTPFLCSAMTGYDGPTGLGTPLSIGAF